MITFFNFYRNQEARLSLHKVIVINDDEHLAKVIINSDETILPVKTFIAELDGTRYQKSENLDHNTISKNVSEIS